MGFNQFALMARSFLKCSPIYNNENLPNIKKIAIVGSKFWKRIAKEFIFVAKVTKFRQNWSQWLE